ncbi:hypothetical protein [Mesorhizobium sp. WSM1293]|uniref:hypothetical protein n=1 Tax=Mesorhizobium sp. WSM1293 TaxID=1040984 RepID=UPI0012EC4DA2|nr:hypothetical protein [Mesorhizobium sp. WSM1293]
MQHQEHRPNSLGMLRNLAIGSAALGDYPVERYGLSESGFADRKHRISHLDRRFESSPHGERSPGFNEHRHPTILFTKSI